MIDGLERLRVVLVELDSPPGELGDVRDDVRGPESHLGVVGLVAAAAAGISRVVPSPHTNTRWFLIVSEASFKPILFSQKSWLVSRSVETRTAEIRLLAITV